MLKKLKNEHYYGSPLNRFIDEKCSHQMDCINFDCVTVKVAQRRIRVIESKRCIEDMTSSERRVYKIFQELTRMAPKEWKVEYFIVMGDEPYEYAHIFDLDENEVATLKQDELIAWLSFETELPRDSQ